MADVNGADRSAQARQVNVRLRPNVICIRLYAWDQTEKDQSLSDDQLKKRLAYWELLEFSRECPFRFSSADHYRDRLTRRQQMELEIFLDPGPRVRHLWPGDGGHQFEPFPASHVEHPFFEQWSDRGERAAGTRGGKAVRPVKSATLPAGPIGSAVLPEAGTPAVWIIEGPRVAAETNDQEHVFRAPAHLHQLVLAPPGTGKTHVLVKRLAELVAKHGVENPASEMLVLSFSRAAVAEVIRRLEAESRDGAHDDLRYVQVRTFDAYATRMLTRGASEVPGLADGHEARIRQFCQFLREGTLPEAAQEEMAMLRFFIVDEVQDLVGDRARMTLQMMEFVQRHGGSVLLLGDPAQAIYDWQLFENDAMNSTEFLRSARRILKQSTDAFREIHLTDYRRFENSELLELVCRCRDAVGDDGSQPDLTRLTNQLQSLAKLPLNQLPNVVSTEERVAILTRTNLEAYQISQWCCEQGIAHRVERGSSGRYWPGWIARLCLGYRMEKMALGTAQRIWDRQVASRATATFAQAREYLRHHGLFGSDVLDLRELSELIQKSQPLCHWPLLEEAVLTISTVHRSKGLEFDRVLLLKAQPGNFSGGDDDQGQGEARVLYVAATRARRSLTMLLRDNEVLLRGNKYCKGYSRKKLYHFHLYDPGQGGNYLLLDGLDEFDQADFLRSLAAESVIKTQDEIWEYCSAGSAYLCAERVDGALAWKLPSGRQLCALNRDLLASLQQIGTTYREGRSASGCRLRNVQAVDVATVSLAWEGGDSIERYLGPARLAMLPVVYGLALIDLDD